MIRLKLFKALHFKYERVTIVPIFSCEVCKGPHRGERSNGHLWSRQKSNDFEERKLSMPRQIPMDNIEDNVIVDAAMRGIAKAQKEYVKLFPLKNARKILVFSCGCIHEKLMCDQG